MKKVVCIGGGTGLAQVLKGLARSGGVKLTGVVGVTDNGGHTGVLRRALGMPAVGDLRSCLAELSDGRCVWAHLLAHRFRRGELDGISTGNLLLASLFEREGSLSGAVRALGRELNLPMEVLPVSDGNSQVCAKLADGRVVRGEWEIILREPRSPVQRIFHRPPLRALPEVRRALAAADLVVFAPGCLLTGIVSTVAVGGVREALRRSKAAKVQVVNLMTQPGQTDGFGARAHAAEFERLTKVRPDALVVNGSRPDVGVLGRYVEAGAAFVADDLSGGGPWTIVRGDFVARPQAGELARLDRGGGKWHARPHFIRHDAAALSNALLGLLRLPGRKGAR